MLVQRCNFLVKRKKKRSQRTNLMGRLKTIEPIQSDMPQRRFFVSPKRGGIGWFFSSSRAIINLSFGREK